MSWMISPRQFADVFDETVSKRAGQIQDNWFKTSEYTHLFLNRSDGILNEVGQRLGLMHWGAEFLRLDATYTTIPAEGEKHRLALVVEHENAVRTAGWEVLKLAYVACPLRVLITYPRSESHGEDLLAQYCSLIEAIGAFATGQLLVAFARLDKPPFAGGTWRYYLYAGSEFLPVYPRS